MHQLRHARLRLDDESGMTLIEMMAALFILSLTMVALLGSAVTSLRSLDVSKHRQDATQLASSTLESTRGMPFNQVALDTDHGSVPADGTNFEGEEVIRSPYGLFVHEEGAPGGFTLTVWVTEVAGSADQRRVVALVSWDDRGNTRTLRQETVVSEARRGLPAPAFDVGPSAATGTYTAPQEWACVEHTLTNLGEQDKYDWSTPGTFQILTGIDHDGDGMDEVVHGFETTSGWEVWTAIDGDPMLDATSDLRPDAVDFVGRNGLVPVDICYRPTSTPPDGEVSFTHTFRSAFDSTVTQAVEDTLSVTGSQYTLYLHHPRLEDGSLDLAAEALLMNGTVPTETNELVNYDNPGDGSPDDRAGLRVPPSEAAVWDYQFQQAAVLGETVEVRLYLAARSNDLSIDGTAELKYQIQLERRTSTGGGTATLLATTADAEPYSSITVTATGSHPWSGELVETLTIDPSASREFLPNEYLRLRFLCHGTINCHVHYDVTPRYLSRVVAEVSPS